MKNVTKTGVFLLLLGIISINSICQTPDGKLYLHFYNANPNSDILTCIDYPNEIYNIIDTTDVSDIAIANDILFTGGKNIYYYNVVNDQKVDSIVNTNIRQLGSWLTYLVCTSNEHPFFRMYDINTKQLIFSLDSFAVSSLAIDLLISDNKAFLLHDTSLQIIDLILKDTIGNFSTPHPFLYAGYNMFIFEANNEVYIDVEYATGATRFSLLKLSKNPYMVNTVFHKDFQANFYKPLAVGNKIYMLGFNSYFDIIADSLVINSEYQPWAIEYDNSSNSIFLYNNSENKINYFNNVSFSNKISVLPFISKALFYDRNKTFIEKNESDESKIAIYPNPNNGIFNLKLSNFFGSCTKYEIYNSLGEHIMSKKFPSNHKSKDKFIQIDVSNFDVGIYYITVEKNNIKLWEKFIIIE